MMKVDPTLGVLICLSYRSYLPEWRDMANYRGGIPSMVSPPFFGWQAISIISSRSQNENLVPTLWGGGIRPVRTHAHTVDGQHASISATSFTRILGEFVFDSLRFIASSRWFSAARPK